MVEEVEEMEITTEVETIILVVVEEEIAITPIATEAITQINVTTI